MHISISTFDAPAIARAGETRACRFVIAVKRHFIQEFIVATEEVGLTAFLKKRAMLIGAVRQQHAAASWNFECPRGVLIRPDDAQKAQSDLCTGQRSRIVIGIYFIALPSLPQALIAMNSRICPWCQPADAGLDIVAASICHHVKSPNKFPRS